MNKTKKIIGLLALTTSLLTLTHCAEPPKTGAATGDYNSAEVGKVNKVVQGTIVSQRTVNVYNRSTIQNNAMGSDSSEVDVGVTRRIGYEYVIKLDSGAIISVVQTENLNLQPRQRILVIYGSSTRVVADEGAEG